MMILDPKEKSEVGSTESGIEDGVEVVTEDGQPLDTSERTYVAVEEEEEEDPS